MHKRGGLSRVLIILGCVIIAASLITLAIYEITKKRPPTNEDAVCAIYGIIPPFFDGALDDREDTSMSRYCYQGFDYMGLISCETLNFELPVLADYDGTRAESTPSVYSGSVYDGSLVIYGGDGRYVFGSLLEADVGEELYFTDVTGARYSYEVKKISHAGELSENPDTEDADLTLITTTREGKYALIKCRIK